MAETILLNDNPSINKLEDIVISATAQNPVTKNTSVLAKSISVDKELVIKSAQFKAQADGNITLTNVTTSGDFPKASGNASVVLASNGIISVKDSTFGETAYNAIEIALAKGYAPSRIDFENVKFPAALSNNAISIFAVKPNAQINIKNCTFEKVSNVLRFSNRDNVSGVVINFENCTIKSWDTNPKWRGLMVMEDNYSNTADLSKQANRFASSKLTINIKDVTGPDGKILNPEDVAAVLGSNNDQQIVYIYNDKENNVPYKGNEARYPKVIFTDSTASSEQKPSDKKDNTASSTTDNKDKTDTTGSTTDKKDDTKNPEQGSDKEDQTSSTTTDNKDKTDNGDKSEAGSTTSTAATDVTYEGIDEKEWSAETGYNLEEIAKSTLPVFGNPDLDTSDPKVVDKLLNEYSVMKYLEVLPREVLLNKIVRGE